MLRFEINLIPWERRRRRFQILQTNFRGDHPMWSPPEALGTSSTKTIRVTESDADAEMSRKAGVTSSSIKLRHELKVWSRLRVLTKGIARPGRVAYYATCCGQTPWLTLDRNTSIHSTACPFSQPPCSSTTRWGDVRTFHENPNEETPPPPRVTRVSPGQNYLKGKHGQYFINPLVVARTSKI
ncbi:hypothetical protein M405DRAFT_845836 [Rhizopogon salebrosus TDB-379]|nr:hypothetical protein M405DRAFT_845836 [Rhizopogon salebrosus TDB-379]